MVTVRIPTQSRKFSRRAHPVRTAMSNVETTLHDLPVLSRFTNKRSLRNRATSSLEHLSKTQRTVVLSLAAGAAFIALDVAIAGIVISYRRRQNAVQEREAGSAAEGGEEATDEILTETFVEEFERTVMA